MLLSFAALLVGFYVLYRHHRKRVHGFSQKPGTLTDEWLAQQARSAVSADNPLFGRLFAGPVKDDHVWVLLREFNHHLIWVCRESAHLGFWALDAVRDTAVADCAVECHQPKTNFADGTIRQEDVGL